MSMLLLNQYHKNANLNARSDQNGPEPPPESMGAVFQPGQGEQDNPDTRAGMEEPTDPEERRENALKDAQARWAKRRKEGYEDYGAEMGKDAKVWETYVKEADRADHELVEGWNKSLDVLLIFAALFSAISTAFVIVSSEDLQQDPADTSAQTLLVISQALVAISNGQSANASAVAEQDPSLAFKPTHAAMIVNTLWYFSLSLSVAVSLVAMLAKEWCYSFMANRTGQMYEQGRRRQQRWEGILRWKMKDVIAFLPMVMHSALFLFALGLCVYLWSICIPVALPVVVTTGVALLIYFSTTVLPLLFDFCPYTTESSRLLQSYLKLLKTHFGSVFGLMHQYYNLTINRMANPPYRRRIYGNEQSSHWQRVQLQVLLWTDSMFKSWARALKHLHSVMWPTAVQTTRFAEPKLVLADGKVPMDLVTSKMLAWLLANSEDSRVTTLALQSLAGADPWLPRLPLLQNGVLNMLHQRLEGHLELDVQHNEYRLRDPLLIHSVSLYFRSLNYILSLHNSEGFYLAYEFLFDTYEEDHDMLEYAAVKNTWNLDDVTFEVGGLLTAGTYESKLELPTDAAVLYELALFGNIHALAATFTDRGFPCYTDVIEQQTRTITTLQQYVDGAIALYPHSIAAAIRHETDQLCTRHPLDASKARLAFLVILVRVSCLPSIQRHPEVLHAIGVALTVSAFVANEYPGWDTPSRNSRQAQSRPSEAASYYYQAKILADRGKRYLSLEASRRKETESLLAFGLLALFEHPNVHTLCEADIAAIIQAIETVRRGQLPNDPITYTHIHTLCEDFTYDDHYRRAIDQFHNPKQQDSMLNEVTKWGYIQALHNTQCIGMTCSHYIDHFNHWCRVESPSPELRSIFFSMIGRRSLPYRLPEQELRNLLFSNNVLTKLDSALLLAIDARDTLTLMDLFWRLVEWIYSNGEDSARQVLSSIAPENNPEIPDSIWSMGLVERWLPKLKSVCSNDPEVVIQSFVVWRFFSSFERKWDLRRWKNDSGGWENPPDDHVERAALRYQQIPDQCRQTPTVEAIHKLALECVSALRQRNASAPHWRPADTPTPDRVTPQADFTDTGLTSADDDDPRSQILPAITGAEMV